MTWTKEARLESARVRHLKALLHRRYGLQNSKQMTLGGTEPSPGVQKVKQQHVEMVELVTEEGKNLAVQVDAHFADENLVEKHLQTYLDLLKHPKFVKNASYREELEAARERAVQAYYDARDETQEPDHDEMKALFTFDHDCKQLETNLRTLHYREKDLDTLGEDSVPDMEPYDDDEWDDEWSNLYNAWESDYGDPDDEDGDAGYYEDDDFEAAAADFPANWDEGPAGEGDQPRDIYGRYDDKLPKSLYRAVRRWTHSRDSSDAIRERAKKYIAGTGDTESDDSWDIMACALLKMLHQCPKSGTTLYRGTAVNSADFDKLMEVGTPWDLNLCGFGESMSGAESWASNIQAVKSGDSKRVVFVLEPNARAMSIQDWSEYSEEQEWLTAGKFRVKRAVRPPYGVATIELEQVEGV
jgi:hypothetical protein